MSAYICSEKAINAIATVAPTALYEDGESAARILLEQNVRSVAYRYSSQVIEAPDYTYRRVDVDLVQLLKTCAAYDYQSCETPDYEETRAAKIVREVRAWAIRNLPGYDDAAWDLR